MDKGHDDDGEARGGERLLGALNKDKVINAGVLVARWFGGVNLGKARFEHICERACWVLHAAGHVPGKGIQHRWGSQGHRLGAGSEGAANSVDAEQVPGVSQSATSQGGKKRERAKEEAHGAQLGGLKARRPVLAAAALHRWKESGRVGGGGARGNGAEEEGVLDPGEGRHEAEDAEGPVASSKHSQETARTSSSNNYQHTAGDSGYLRNGGGGRSLDAQAVARARESERGAVLEQVGWECAACTLINAGAQIVCSLCDSPRSQT